MDGGDAIQFSFLRMDQIETLMQKVEISASDKKDPQLLSQRHY